MDFVILQSFDNYMEAHLLMSKLQSENIECWLQDENTLTINPLWTNALGGIKLFVTKQDSGLLMRFSRNLKTIVGRLLSVQNAEGTTLNWSVLHVKQQTGSAHYSI
jgi:hypothetical protein